MNNLDNFSKRILVIAVSIAIVLLSASAFLFSVQNAVAQNTGSNLGRVVGISVDDTHIYFMLTDKKGKHYTGRTPKKNTPDYQYINF